MTPPARTPEPSPPGSVARAPDRARRRLEAARTRYERSWIQELVVQLNALQFFDWTLGFAAELLWSALPFIILLSSLANQRIDRDLSRHIGLDSHGARIVADVFRSSPSHALIPIATGLLFAFAGVIAVVSSLQIIYERLFGQEHRRWRDFPRYVAWVAILLAVLVADGAVEGPVRGLLGQVIQSLLTVVVVMIFFAWTMHFLLAGRVPWRAFIRPALVTAVLWLGLAYFSSVYFSSMIVDDTKTFGTVGVVFTLLTWFVLIGNVIMVGAACGAVWNQRSCSAPASEIDVAS